MNLNKETVKAEVEIEKKGFKKKNRQTSNNSVFSHWKKPDTKEKKKCDFIYMKSEDKADHRDRK